MIFAIVVAALVLVWLAVLGHYDRAKMTPEMLEQERQDMNVW